jgi:hypothetical protein
MIQQETFRRFAKNATAYLGQAAPHTPCYCYVEQTEADLDSGQTVIYGLEKLLVTTTHAGDGKTYVAGIRTYWRRYLRYNTGAVIATDQIEEDHWTNQKDLQDFFNMFANPILRFMLNGLVRAISFFGKNNYQPLFDATGARIPDTAYNTDAEGPGNYSSHNADGTPIDPAGEAQDVTPWRA